VRVIWPAEPVPTLTLPADSCSVPGDTLVAEPACWPRRSSWWPGPGRGAAAEWRR
jgi:hypothetical protein